MERLTKKSLEYKGEWIADGKLSNIEGVVRGQAIDKLKELEDLMELYHCNDTDELKKKLENWGKLEKFITGLYAKAEYGGIEHSVTSYILREMDKLEKGDK